MKPAAKFYDDELAYITGVRPSAPGSTFNNDPDCFIRYVEMQATQAKKDGFDDIGAEMIAHIADQLYPYK